MDFLSANSEFEVQNEGTYLPRITRGKNVIVTTYVYKQPSNLKSSSSSNTESGTDLDS